MNTLEKEFVPYQESLELKELGFDESCFGYFNTTSYLGIGSFVFKECDKSTIDGYGNKPLLRPTFSQAFRWFREKGYDVKVQKESAVLYFGFYWTGVAWITVGAGSYEEAELACLRKLIEILKDGNK